MRFSALHIKNFRSIPPDGVNIRFTDDRNIATLIGVNGAGKSNIVQALGIVLAAFPFTRFDPNENDFHCKNTDNEIQIELRIAPYLTANDVYQKPFEIAGFRYRAWLKKRGDGKGTITTEHVCIDEDGEPRISKIEVESDGNAITVTAHFNSIANALEARAVASIEVERLLDHIATHECLRIGLTVAATTDLVPINPNPNVLEAEAGEIVISGAAARLVLGLGPSATAKLKTDLDDPAPRGENYFVLFRAAQRSESAVERFLLFYALLLLIVVRGPDEQRVVDAFIRREEPLVPETRRPDKHQIKETIYSRLRNEIGHKRQNANIAQTRAEIEGRVDSLARLVQRAIATLA